MSEAPERIWACMDGPMVGLFVSGGYDAGWPEYVRADLFDAVKDGCDALEARVKALTGAVGESVVKLDHAASIIRNNYLHQPEKCDDARSICVDLATDLRAALQENTDATSP